MPIPASINDLSTTASSNGPAGSETPTDGDGYLRAHAGFIAELRDNLNGTTGAVGLKLANTGSADQTTFDYYAEGTFTPALAFGGGSTGLTYSSRSGKYTRLGSVVFFYLELVLSAKGSSTGDATISGLPYTASGGAKAEMFWFTDLTVTGAGFGTIGSGGTSINLNQQASTTYTSLTHAAFGNGATLSVQGFYFA